MHKGVKRGASLWDLPTQVRVAEGSRRLNLLANLLEERVKPERFDLRTWSAEACEEGSCGTSACAVGWACSFPEFIEMGLSMSKDFDPAYGVFPQGVSSDVAMDHYNAYTGWDAVCHCFGIYHDQATMLFDFYEYHGNNDCDYDNQTEVTIPEVVARIRNFTSKPRLLP